MCLCVFSVKQLENGLRRSILQSYIKPYKLYPLQKRSEFVRGYAIFFVVLPLNKGKLYTYCEFKIYIHIYIYILIFALTRVL